MRFTCCVEPGGEGSAERNIPLQMQRDKLLEPVWSQDASLYLPPNCIQPRSSGSGRTPQIGSSVPFTAVHAVREFFYGSPPARLTRLSRAWVPASASYTIYPGTRSLRRTASGCAFDAYISPLPPFPGAWKSSVECGYVDGDQIAEDRPI